ncbi:MAG: lipid-A-disaccharide synthase [Legionellales bacterium]|nr:lipid-A-disaccharide synthase [Legionellales bacterium]
MSNPTRIVIVCGEASGDRLGAGLLAELKSKLPHAQFEGVAGPLMEKQGLKPWFSYERINYMGFVDPLLNIRSIYGLYNEVCKRCLDNPPDLFIGIDAPEFNLRVEKKLKANGIKTLHYVGPSVWAWRKKRIFSIKRAVSHIMVLFPFETDIYKTHQIPVTCVGMKLADDIPLGADESFKVEARNKYGLTDKPLITLLGGSRKKEIDMLAPIILTIAEKIQLKVPQVQFLIACLNEKSKKQWESILLKAQRKLSIQLTVNDTRTAIAAADVVLAKSGTVTLETMLLKKPMVVIYKVSFLNYLIGRCLLTLKHFALPNLLAKKSLVSEYIQKINPSVVADEMVNLLNTPQTEMISEFDTIHKSIALNADKQSAQVAYDLIKDS